MSILQKFDPCLFMNESLIVIIYVDDILTYGRTEAEIEKNDVIALSSQSINISMIYQQYPRL